MDLPAALQSVPVLRLRAGAAAAAAPRGLAVESAIAVTIDRATHAVMMATPADLEDFAVGFALAEGLIAAPADIDALEILSQDLGIEARITLRAPASPRAQQRRRAMLGAAGCGLCGVESLQAALPRLPRVGEGGRFSADQVMAAVASLHDAQVLNQASHAVHAAAYWHPQQGLVCLREDVGRHNALDKLVGAMAREGVALSAGIVVLTSRIAIELVQKAARAGVCVLAGISAPTSTAVQVAHAAGMTLIGIARADGFEVFCHETRLDLA